MTRSKFNSKFRMSGIRSMFFIFVFVCIVCIPIGLVVKTLTPEKYVPVTATQNDENDDIINDNTDKSVSEDDTSDDTAINQTDEGSHKGKKQKVKFDKKAKNGYMPGVASDAFNNIDKEKFVYVVNKSISMQDGNSEANILIYNPKQNSFNLSLKISVNGEDIYTTDILKPNQYIENDFFDTQLSKGEYNGEIEVIAYDKNTNEKQEVYTDNVKITVSK